MLMLCLEILSNFVALDYLHQNHDDGDNQQNVNEAADGIR